MLKENTNPYARLKYLLLVPAFAIAVSVFAHPELSRIDELSDAESTEKNTIEQNKLAYPLGAVELKSSDETYPQKETKKTNILSENNADLQKPSGDPSDTINLKEYKVVGYIKGKKVDFNQWKNFERKDGYIHISMDSAFYYKGDKMMAYTKGGTVHISENTKNLSAETIQRQLISTHILPQEKYMKIVKSVGGTEAFFKSIDLDVYRVEAYRNGKKINFDEWNNFRKGDDYVIVEIDSISYYKEDIRIGKWYAKPGPFQVNISKKRILNGETIQRMLIGEILLQKGINPNE